MITNSDMTVYHYEKGAYVRTHIGRVHWHSRRISNVTDKGVVGADMVIIRIPMNEIAPGFQIHKNDIVVKGCHPAIQSLDDLINIAEKGKVADFSVNDYGLNPHIRIGAEA
ncbi:hypothetical protein NIA70_05315 [[Clostridium] scindens]|uniref:DUF6751 family protein n=1 Tax=Clostridium scindens (strain JCM 10418 / VPI 12708) TaxID=29347 RepID=UPI002057ED37|nr:DUF6751 family protein [[Clostridium] scindens]MCO7171574.1 hypothetical protein [[Clostridium] scindens]DAL41784.1 MAG TPA_asm: hypothetical protein [Caudoviricetes sp.]